MKSQKIRFEDVEIKITSDDDKRSSQYTCSKEHCKELAYGAIIFPNIDLKCNFCKNHEEYLLKPTRELSSFQECKSWFIEYYPQKELPKDILELAEKAGIENIKSFTDNPEKLNGIRVWLNDIINNPGKYEKEKSVKEVNDQ